MKLGPKVIYYRVTCKRNTFLKVNRRYQSRFATLEADGTLIRVPAQHLPASRVSHRVTDPRVAPIYLPDPEEKELNEEEEENFLLDFVSFI